MESQKSLTSKEKRDIKARVTCGEGHGDVYQGWCYNCETAVEPTQRLGRRG